MNEPAIAIEGLRKTVSATFSLGSLSLVVPRGTVCAYVLQTLPLTRTTRVLYRWLASFAVPSFVVLGCMGAAAALNIYKEWPLPAPASLLSSCLAAIALLGGLRVFPAHGFWMAVWGAAGIAGLIGLPELPAEVAGSPTWPLWAGALSAPSGLPYMPAWFLAYLGIFVLFFSIVGYRALLGGIRSTAVLEGEPQVLLDAA